MTCFRIPRSITCAYLITQMWNRHNKRAIFIVSKKIYNKSKYLWISDKPTEWRRFGKDIIFLCVLRYFWWIDKRPRHQRFVQVDYFFLTANSNKISVRTAKNRLIIDWTVKNSNRSLTFFWYDTALASGWFRWSDRSSALSHCRGPFVLAKLSFWCGRQQTFWVGPDLNLNHQ